MYKGSMAPLPFDECGLGVCLRCHAHHIDTCVVPYSVVCTPYDSCLAVYVCALASRWAP